MALVERAPHPLPLVERAPHPLPLVERAPHPLPLVEPLPVLTGPLISSPQRARRVGPSCAGQPLLSKVRSCAYFRGRNGLRRPYLVGLVLRRSCAGLILSPALRKIRRTFRYGKGITLRYAQGRSFPSLCSLKPTQIPTYTNYGRTGITVLCRIVRTLLVNTAWNGKRRARSGNGVES